MEKSERGILDKINRSIPRGLIKRLMDKERPMQGEKYKIQEQLDRIKVDGSSRATEQQKRYLNKIVSNPLYDQEKQSVNEKVGKEIEKFVEYRVKREIKEGNLKPRR